MDLDLEADGHLLDSLFPARMGIKVIAVDLAGIDAMLVSRLAELQFEAVCRPGNVSKQGKYITWEVEADFDSRADFQAALTALAQVEGVKYVL
jgi:putative lipoic acid-binding regulatory protein